MISNKFENNASVKKYELIKDQKASELNLYRVRALRDFGDVKRGDVGGFVEGEHNLSHQGKCWIAGVAQVTGNARVCDDAVVGGLVSIHGNEKIFGNMRVGFEEYNFGRPHGQGPGGHGPSIFLP